MWEWNSNGKLKNACMNLYSRDFRSQKSWSIQKRQWNYSIDMECLIKNACSGIGEVPTWICMPWMNSVTIIMVIWCRIQEIWSILHCICIRAESYFRCRWKTNRRKSLYLCQRISCFVYSVSLWDGETSRGLIPSVRSMTWLRRMICERLFLCRRHSRSARSERSQSRSQIARG